jgi:Ca2+-binding EF-hand superfamily protein
MKPIRVITWFAGAILAIAMIAGVTTASGQKSSTGAQSGKQWLAAMDSDHDGTVSKQEFTTYMQAQFDKADADHDGTLDANELGQLRKNLAIALNQ